MYDRKNVEKVCFLGDKGVGKTALFHNLSGRNYYQPYQTTVKVNFHTRVHEKGAMQYWDFPNESVSYYMQDAQQIVLVFSKDNRMSFDALPRYLNIIKKYAPHATVSVVGAANEHMHYDESIEDLIQPFLSHHHIEHYLPLWTTSNASMNTLLEHLLKNQGQHLLRANSPANFSRQSPVLQNSIYRNSPDSITATMYRTFTQRLSQPVRTFFNNTVPTFVSEPKKAKPVILNAK